MVPYSKLYDFASKREKLLMYIGWFASGLAGVGIPSFVFVIAEVIDSFNSSVSADEMLTTIRKSSLIFFGVGIGVWLAAYASFTLLLIISE